jgi:hypothetical protein
VAQETAYVWSRAGRFPRDTHDPDRARRPDQRKEDFQLVLNRFALERLLHRIDQSPHRDRFVVKGAMLFPLWTDQPYRPTRDIDFLAYGDHSVAHLEAVFREVCDLDVEDDGVVFGSNSVVGDVIKPDQAGLSGSSDSTRGEAGAGAHSIENFDFDGELVALALKATFERRRTPIPEAIPAGLTAEFHDDGAKQKQWKAFVSNGGLAAAPRLPEIIARLRTFLLPPAVAIRAGTPFRRRWIQPGSCRHSDDGARWTMPPRNTERRTGGVSPPVFRMPAHLPERFAISHSVKSADGQKSARRDNAPMG